MVYSDIRVGSERQNFRNQARVNRAHLASVLDLAYYKTNRVTADIALHKRLPNPLLTPRCRTTHILKVRRKSFLGTKLSRLVHNCVTYQNSQHLEISLSILFFLIQVAIPFIKSKTTPSNAVYF